MDESNWDQSIRRMQDDIRQAQESGDHEAARKLQDGFVKYECMDAGLQLLRNKGRLDYCEEVAARAEKVSPGFAKTLKKAVAKYRELEKTRKPYDYQGMLRKMDEDVKRAEQRGDHETARVLRDRYVEFECMNKAMKRMPDMQQQITHYEGIAARVELINPAIAKTLREAAARLRATVQ